MEAFGRIAKKGNTILLPANANDPASMVAQAMSVFRSVQGSSVRQSFLRGRALHDTSV